MKLKIRIKTPKGGAKGMDFKVRPFILGWRVKPIVEINPTNDQILWTVDVDSKRAMKIIKNLSLFDSIVSQVMDSKKVKKAVKKYGDEGSYDELESMLKDHTTVERIHITEGFDISQTFIIDLHNFYVYLNPSVTSEKKDNSS